MKIVRYQQKDGTIRGGLLQDGRVCPLPASGGDDVVAFIAKGVTATFVDEGSIALADVTLLAPLQQPPRIFGIGLNYVEHAAESKMKVQAVPTVFFKLSSAVVGLGRTPQRWLKPDEEMVVTVEGIGELRNKTVAE